MTAVATAPPSAAPAPAPTKEPPRMHRFTVEQYHEMIRAGILGRRDRVELLEGLVVEKMPSSPLHSATTGLSALAIQSRLPLFGVECYVRWEQPMTTSTSEPEPDLMLVRGTPRDYLGRHPGPADLLLLIEVANSSLADDRTRKARLYARAGVPDYWILVVAEGQDRRVEVRTRPTAAGYQQTDVYRRGESIPLATPAGGTVSIPVDELLP